ncbi:Na+/H+ antiporter subunit E [Phototrophicus methaneseepsis]|uniref:Na+/H+ antiporter subunit E n=1 Tax=Phototrophicus methaneseepsis TaxID=2710758 RepID=A0A7S8EE59_9CHLR|nr:Na+/H+ antiporter subunit E [Phototrophicus methaneseepsis]QPC85058.1 Na+/H+ antiporter subunit E [Phototrophicus methaneseepsis]
MAQDTNQEPKHIRYSPISALFFAFPMAIIWVILTSNPTLHNLILGYIFSLVISWAIRTNTDLPPVGDEMSLKNIPGQVWAITGYILRLSVDILRSGIDVAQRVLRPNMDIDPGMYVLRVHDPDERGLVEAITAHGITITPGSLVIDFDEENDIVIVHVLDRNKWTVQSLDEEQLTRVRRIHRMLGDRNPDTVSNDPAEYLDSYKSR